MVQVETKYILLLSEAGKNAAFTLVSRQPANIMKRFTPVEQTIINPTNHIANKSHTPVYMYMYRAFPGVIVILQMGTYLYRCFIQGKCQVISREF